MDRRDFLTIGGFGYCAEFSADRMADFKTNATGEIQASFALAPTECPAVCGQQAVSLGLRGFGIVGVLREHRHAAVTLADARHPQTARFRRPRARTRPDGHGPRSRMERTSSSGRS